MLLRPLPLVTLALVLLNDHVLKGAWPGLVTGKLSDLAGAFLLPVLVLSISELVVSRRGRPRLASARAVTGVCSLTGVGLVLVKTWPAATSAYGALVGLVRYPFLGSFHHVQVATDPTDLVAFASVGLAWVYALAAGRSPAESLGAIRLRGGANADADAPARQL